MSTAGLASLRSPTSLAPPIAKILAGVAALLRMSRVAAAIALALTLVATTLITAAVGGLGPISALPDAAAQAVVGEAEYDHFGTVTLSVDGGFDTSAITIDKPAGATVEAVYVFAAGDVASGQTPSSLTVAGTTVGITSLSNRIDSGQGLIAQNGWADATAQLGGYFNSLPPGANNLVASENGPGEGWAVMVVWNDPAAADGFVKIRFTAIQTNIPSVVSIPVDALDVSDPDFQLEMGVGISFSLGDAEQLQTSTLNGTVISTAAGGHDDGIGANGALWTIGGYGDNPNNPRSERYDLAGAVSNGDTSIDLRVVNNTNHPWDYLGIIWLAGNSIVSQEDPDAPPPEPGPDTDSDGVPDSTDIDDDNDGILDVDEGFVGEAFVEGLIRNGDFNQNYINSDSPGVPFAGAVPRFAPNPWTILSTADLSSASQISFSTDVRTRASLPGFSLSPSGGSFMGYRGSEGIAQQVTVDDPTRELTILYDYTEYLQPGTFDEPSLVNVEFRVKANPFFSAAEGSIVVDVPNLTESGGTQGTWESRSATFRPSDFGLSNTFSVAITANGSTNNIWAFVDGFGVLEGGAVGDTDGDRIGNSLDLDSDNDGIADIYEAGNSLLRQLDSNGNGTIDALDGFVDGDGDGLDDRIESVLGPNTGATPVNTDGADVGDWLDLDSDGDGIPDATEARPTTAYVAYPPDPTRSDADGDGIINAFDVGASFGSSASVFATPTRAPRDTDGSEPDYVDTDSDADGISDAVESDTPAISGVSYSDPDGNIDNPLSAAGGSIVMENRDSNDAEVDFRSLDVVDPGPDTDGDGIPDTIDIDDDNDGVLDVDEGGIANGLPPAINSGTWSGSDSYNENGNSSGTIEVLLFDSLGFGGQGLKASPAPDDRPDINVTIRPKNNWLTMTVDDFQQYDVLWIGADNCEGTAWQDFRQAIDSRAVWETAIDPARVVISGGDYDFHYYNSQSTTQQIVHDTLAYTANGNGPGLVLQAGCYADFGTSWFDRLGGTFEGLGHGSVSGDPDFVNADHFFNRTNGYGYRGAWAFGAAIHRGMTIQPGSPVEDYNLQTLHSLGGVPGFMMSDPDVPPALGERDTDGDGVVDRVDLDSDNDGIADIYEAGSVVLRQLDSDGDGYISASDPSGFVDADGDGLDDRLEFVFAPDQGATPIDTSNADGDSLADMIDLDSDDDGIPDATEARATNAYVAYPADPMNADADGDGVIDVFDAGFGFGSNNQAFKTPVREPEDTDRDGSTPDYVDLDSDEDGKSDTDESDEPRIRSVSYADPDGNIDDPLSAAGGSIIMENVDDDESDVDFRSTNNNPGLQVVKTVVELGSPCPDFDAGVVGLDTIDAAEGERVTYCVSIRNTGSGDAVNVIATDEFDAGSPRNVGTVAVDSDVSYSFDRTVPAGSESSAVSVEATDIDDNPVPPVTDSAGTVPTAPDIQVRQTVVAAGEACPTSYGAAFEGLDTIEARPDETVTYCVNVRNNGPGVAYGIVANDAFDSSSPRSLGRLNPRSETTYSYAHVVGADAEINTATVTANNGDGAPAGSDTDRAGTTAAQPALEIRVTAIPASLPCPQNILEAVDGFDVADVRLPGQVRYCVNIVNNGTGDAFKVSVSDLFDPFGDRVIDRIDAGEQIAYDYFLDVDGPQINIVEVGGEDAAGNPASTDRDEAGVADDGGFGVVDRDGDGVSEGADPDDGDACNPDPAHQFCDGDGDGWSIGGGDPDDADACNPDPDSTACAGEVSDGLRGDVNCDNKVTVADALVIAQYVSGNRTPATCPLGNIAANIDVSSADYNLDGFVNIVDSLILTQCVVGIENPNCAS